MKMLCFIGCLLLAAEFRLSAQPCFEQALPHPDSYILRYKSTFIPLGQSDTARDEYTIYATGKNEHAYYTIYNTRSNLKDIRDSSGFYRYTFSNNILAKAGVPDTNYLRNRVMKLISTNYLRDFLENSPHTIDSSSTPGYYIYKLDSLGSRNRSIPSASTWFTMRAYYNCSSKVIDKFISWIWMGGTESYDKVELLSINRDVPGIYDSIRLDMQPIYIRKRIVVDDQIDSLSREVMKWKNTKFPDFDFPRLPNGKLRLYKQDAQLYIIDFHYKACVPCWAMHDELNKFQQQYGRDRIRIIGINHNDNQDAHTLSFYAKKNPLYDIVFSDKVLKDRYRIFAYPTVFILNRKFEIIDIIEGYSEQNIQRIEKHITKSK